MSRTIGTVLSANSGASVGDALRSVLEYIDCVLLLDTGITDGTRQIAAEIVGERLIVESFPWCGDFAQARNFALDAAARQGRAWGAAGGAVWAMTLDTDERLEFPGYASREELAAALESDPRVRVWLVREKGGRYAKERFIRVENRGQRTGDGEPRTGAGGREPGGGELRWVGRVHEALVGAGPGEARVLPGAFFGETPKSPEAFEAKLARDLAILQEESCLAEVESRHAGLAPPIETPCEDLARILGEYADDDYVVVKMDVEGAEFALLRHLLARGVAGRMNVLLVEWHERFVPEETAESREKLDTALREQGVNVVRWE